MANHKSAEKRARQLVKRTILTRAMRSYVRGLVKTAHDALDAGSDDAAELAKSAAAQLDRAGSKNAIPKKRTARLKSRLMKHVVRASK